MNYSKSNGTYGPTLELCLKTVPLSSKTYYVENLILFIMGGLTLTTLEVSFFQHRGGE